MNAFQKLLTRLIIQKSKIRESVKHLLIFFKISLFSDSFIKIFINAAIFEFLINLLKNEKVVSKRKFRKVNVEANLSNDIIDVLSFVDV